MQRPTLEQAVAIVTLLTALGSGGYWVATRYQTVDDARAHEERDHRAISRLLYGQSKQETLTLRNRVNDCDARPVKPGERAACEQYRREYEESKSRTDELYRGLRK